MLVPPYSLRICHSKRDIQTRLRDPFACQLPVRIQSTWSPSIAPLHNCGTHLSDRSAISVPMDKTTLFRKLLDLFVSFATFKNGFRQRRLARSGMSFPLFSLLLNTSVRVVVFQFYTN